MSITFSETYGPISAKMISDFEADHGITLPQSYKDYLLQWNGGRPSWTILDVPKWPGKATALHFLFGIHAGKRNNLGLWYDELRDRLPEGFLAIGVDMGGGFLCLGTSGKFVGEVWYWDSSNDYDLDDGTMFRVGTSIGQFLNQLRESY